MKLKIMELVDYLSSQDMMTLIIFLVFALLGLFFIRLLLNYIIAILVLVGGLIIVGLLSLYYFVVELREKYNGRHGNHY